jgi:hypothetical protein
MYERDGSRISNLRFLRSLQLVEVGFRAYKDQLGSRA